MTDEAKPATDEEIADWRERSAAGRPFSEQTVMALIARIDVEKARADHWVQVNQHMIDEAEEACPDWVFKDPANLGASLVPVDLVATLAKRIAALEAENKKTAWEAVYATLHHLKGHSFEYHPGNMNAIAREVLSND